MMGGRQTGVRGRLAGALKALSVSKLREHERSGRRSDPRDRFQKVLVSSEGIGALDVFVDRFFKLADLLVDAFEHRLKRAGNRRVFRLADLVFQAVALFFEFLKATGHLLQAFLLPSFFAQKALASMGLAPPAAKIARGAERPPCRFSTG